MGAYPVLPSFSDVPIMMGSWHHPDCWSPAPPVDQSALPGQQAHGPGLETPPIVSLLYKIAFSINKRPSSLREFSVEN